MVIFTGSAEALIKIRVIRRGRLRQIRQNRRSASQPAIEVEDGILAFLRVKDAETGADRPFIRRAPGDSQPRREVVVIGIDQPGAQPAVPGNLKSEGRKSRPRERNGSRRRRKNSRCPRGQKRDVYSDRTHSRSKEAID